MYEDNVKRQKAWPKSRRKRSRTKRFDCKQINERHPVIAQVLVFVSPAMAARSGGRVGGSAFGSAGGSRGFGGSMGGGGSSIGRSGGSIGGGSSLGGSSLGGSSLVGSGIGRSSGYGIISRFTLIFEY
jgi:hypothetical protein